MCIIHGYHSTSLDIIRYIHGYMQFIMRYSLDYHKVYLLRLMLSMNNPDTRQGFGGKFLRQLSWHFSTKRDRSQRITSPIEVEYFLNN